jgi:prolyl-tRNA synthetase
VGLDLMDDAVLKQAELVYQALQKAGIEVFYDDRPDVMAGAKFADYDLIGVPYRLVVSRKSGQQVEMKRRTESEVKIITLEEAVKALTSN